MPTNQLHGLPASSSTSSTALRGASLAFQNSTKSHGSTAAPSADTHEGALAAATISAQTTGGSATGLPDIDHHQARSIINSRLQQHAQYLSPKSGGKDASFIAATLAASRSVSPSPRARRSPSMNTIGSHAGSPSNHHAHMSHLGSPATGEHVDGASIPPTDNLIRMFEDGSPRRRQGGSVDEGNMLRRRLTPSPKRIQRLPRDLSQESLEEEVEEEEEEEGVEQEKTPSRLPQQSARPKTPPPKPAITRQKPTPERVARNNRQNKPPPGPRGHSPPSRPLVESQPRDQPVKDKADKPRPKPVEAKKKPSKPPKPTAISPEPSQVSGPRSSFESKSYNMAELRSPVLGRSTTEVQSPKPVRLTKPPLPPPTPPQPPRTTSRPSPQLQSPGEPEKRDSPQPKKSQPPTPPKPRGNTRVTRSGSLKHGLERIRTTDSDLARTSETDSPQDVFVSAPTSPTSTPPPPPRPPQRLPSPAQRAVGRNTPSPTRWPHRPSHYQQSRSSLDLNSMTSAIMAGSLASSRLTPHNTGTGSSLPPLPPQRTRSPRLRSTMRNTAAQSSDSEDDRHKRSHRPKLRSGKHAHHEGARKKWRDQVGQRERKRYEAVWASNRGYQLPATSSGNTSSIRSGTREGPSTPPNYSDYIANVVVRDIWRRSRLPEDELMEVWELVDRKKRGMLDRSEFVVGMWLIDQRLKGRKIPQKVTDSVWASANGMLRVKTPRKH